MNIFNSAKNRKSIPDSWCGLWVDKNGKQLIIHKTKHSFYDVTILDNKDNAYNIDLLDDSKKTTKNLKAEFKKDTDGISNLQIEAGVDGIGPTYNLYFFSEINETGKRYAKNSDDINKIIIVPSVIMGLYNDWEDDLGVPWAFPLEIYKKK